MRRDEWLDLGEHITAKWPHQPAPVEALAAWYEDVGDLDPQQVRAAIASFAREGREWPPTGGMLRRRVFELATDAPAFGEAWSLIVRAAERFGYMRRGEAFDWLREHHEILTTLARQVGWRDICHEPPTVVEGQARRIYEQLVERTHRDLALAGLPDSGLTTLERVNSPEYRKLIAQTMRSMPQIGAAE